MRNKIEVSFRWGGGLFGVRFPWFIPTLFPGAEPGLPISYLTYIEVGVGFCKWNIMVGLRIPETMIESRERHARK